MLVVGLLGGGLISLLLLNTILAQGSFRLETLQERNTKLTHRVEALQQEVSYQASPDVLAQKARSLGMVPSKHPAFLDLDSDAPRAGRGGGAEREAAHERGSEAGAVQASKDERSATQERGRGAGDLLAERGHDRPGRDSRDVPTDEHPSRFFPGLGGSR